MKRTLSETLSVKKAVKDYQGEKKTLSERLPRLKRTLSERLPVKKTLSEAIPVEKTLSDAIPVEKTIQRKEK